MIDWDKHNYPKESLAVEIHERAKGYFSASEQFAYKFLMEIKKIRDEKLYKELGFGDFESYTLDSFGYTRETITNRIQTAETWGRDYDEALRHFGKTKTRQLGIMPEKERKKIIEDGIDTDEGIKSVNEATTREIETYQKQLKEKDKAIENLKWHNAQKDEEIEAAKNEQKVVKEEVIKEVVPEDYEELKSSNQQLSNALREANRSHDLMQEQYNNLVSQQKEEDENSQKYKELNQAIREMQGKMDRTQKLIQAQKQVYELVDMSKELLMKITPIPYLIDSELVRENPVAKRELENIANQTQSFLNNLNDALKESQIMEGEFTNAE